jgi:short subunit dehydrogenase-like uncharacterized protein
MWLLYGANGTTGQILLKVWAENREASPPILLAGRQESALQALAKTYDLLYKAFPLDQLKAQDLKGIRLVVNFAGPYESTQEPWLRYCEQHGLAYLDISGEWKSLAKLYQASDRWTALGLPILTSAGFDTVAGEAALWLFRQKHPRANRFHLGIWAEGGFSAGTARSAFRMLPHGFWHYEGGRLVRAGGPITRAYPRGKPRAFWPATLAELITFPAWQSVSRLETYVAVPPRYARWTPLLERVVSIVPAAHLLDRMLMRQRTRLATEMDLTAESYLFVEAEEVPERLWVRTEQAYLFTARSVLETVKAFYEEGAQPGVASAFSRYPQRLWERLPFQMQYQAL